jgi:hypothetical protein
VYFFYPETANLTLEEIDFLFTDRARHPSLRAHINASGDNGAGGNGGGVAAGKESESTSPVEVREDHVKEENYN